MKSFEDYEVLNIIGTNLNNTYYKVRNKSTSELLVIKAINYESSCEYEDVIKKRKSESHNVLLDVRNFIIHEETNTVYSITEYCKYGSLSEILKQCTKNEEYIDEDFIWNMLYKLTCYIKIFKQAVLNLFEIYVDDNFNVKLINVTLKYSDDENVLKDLGLLIKAVVKPGNEYYSAELNNILNFLSESDKTVVPTVDAILCHPTVIFKIAQPRAKQLFIKKPKAKEKEKVADEKIDFAAYQIKLENLRNREAALKANEDKLLERCRALDRREKKISLMERIVKEKNARADLYLKRTRDVKPRVSNKKGNVKEEDLVDTSLSADCGDTSLLPTSRKLNVQDIIKPPKFSRTLSERRVRFKSHSPLKDIHLVRRTTVSREQLAQADSDKATENDTFKKPGKVNRTRFKAHSPLKEIHNIKRDASRRRSLIIEQKSEALQSDSDKSSEKSGTEKTRKKSLLSNIFSKKVKKPNSVGSSSDTHTYEDVEKDWEDVQDCKPINWTVESKRQAFDLLRVMNAEQIKHTYL